MLSLKFPRLPRNLCQRRRSQFLFPRRKSQLLLPKVCRTTNGDRHRHRGQLRSAQAASVPRCPWLLSLWHVPHVSNVCHLWAYILVIYYLWFWTFLRHGLLKEVTMSNCYLKFLISSLRGICKISSMDMFIEQSISCSLLHVTSSLRHRYCLFWGDCGEAEATGGGWQKGVSPRHRWTQVRDGKSSIGQIFDIYFSCMSWN